MIIAIIGRPNVGKSTLFNKMAGEALAIVTNESGVTRDRKTTIININGHDVTIVDTAGVESMSHDSQFAKEIFAQTQKAIEIADLILFVVDGRAGISSIDQELALMIRKSNKQNILLINKCESKVRINIDVNDIYKLACEEHLFISAEHKIGFDSLLSKINKYIPKNSDDKEFEKDQLPNSKKEIIKISIIGRPNVGKSTFINTLINEKRLLTDDSSGTTRDSIDIDFAIYGKKVKLIDTAGIRKKNKIYDNLEKLAVQHSIKSLSLANVVILIIDAENPLEKQEMHLAGKTIDEGKSLIIAINKWDKIDEDKKKYLLDDIEYKINHNFKGLKGCSIIPISALQGKNVKLVIKSALKSYDQWNMQITTSKLNNWLRKCENENPPILVRGKNARLKYVSQINKRPPTFAIFTNHPMAINNSYKGYLLNSLRKNFNLQLTPIRIVIKKTDNPYVQSGKKLNEQQKHRS